MAARNVAMMSGYPSGSGFSPSTDHIRVDGRAFPREQWVLVNAEVLGSDAGLWDGRAQMSGQVLQRYYHEVHGQPLFSIDFARTIGKREVLVLECMPDDSKNAVQVTRALDFGSCAVHEYPGSGTTTPGARCVEQGGSTVIEAELSDKEWVPTSEDFPLISSPSAGASPCGSYSERPLQELGLYDDEEDTTSWDFSTVWSDDQWQQTDLTMLGNSVFTGQNQVRGRLEWNQATPRITSFSSGHQQLSLESAGRLIGTLLNMITMSRILRMDVQTGSTWTSVSSFVGLASSSSWA